MRPAGPSDASRLAQLRWAFRTEHARPAEDEAAFLARAAAWFEDRLAGDRWRAWVAEVDGGEESGPVVVGQVVLQVVEKVPNPVVEAETLGYLTNVFVLPGWRGRGLGRQLIVQAVQWCEGAGLDTLVLWPTQQSVPMYRRLGFIEQPMALDLTR